ACGLACSLHAARVCGAAARVGGAPPHMRERGMRERLLGWMLLAGLAACTSDPEPTSFASAPVADPSASPVPDTAAGAALPGRAAGSTSFASLPDRGELLAYGGARKSRQSGAYHYHPVALSEEHALNAIASGEMVLT